MTSLKDQQVEWHRHRTRIARETRVLVVDSDATVREQLDDLLFRLHIPSRSVASADQALDQIASGNFAVVITAEVIRGMRGLALTRQLRVTQPEIDVVLTSWDPSVATLSQAFELRLLDLLLKPFDDLDAVGEVMTQAVKRSVDRRMRSHVLGGLRQMLEQLAPEARLRMTAALDQRLSAFKRSLGRFDRVLVVERTDQSLRHFSEQLLLAGLAVETATELDEGIDRVSVGDVYLFLVNADDEIERRGLDGLLTPLRRADPHVHLGLVTTTPRVETALQALRADVAAYLPWPPPAIGEVVLWVQDILRRGRRERLLDNLFVELYRETHRVLGDLSTETEDFQNFRQLIGLRRVLASGEQPQIVIADQPPPLDDLISSVDDQPPAEDADRRVYTRVADSHFVRFRPRSASVSQLAYLGNISEGGLFICTPTPLKQGSVVEVDFNAIHEGRAYAVRCWARVAWTTTDDRASPGRGFGVRFVDPPDDLRQLLRRIVAKRAGTTET